MWIIVFCRHDESLGREKENQCAAVEDRGGNKSRDRRNERIPPALISTGCSEVNTTGFSPELCYGVNPAGF